MPLVKCWLQKKSTILETLCIWEVINRPGLAGAVLQTPSSLINSVSESVSQPFPPNLQDIINHKP